jgi:hypothetical protein
MFDLEQSIADWRRQMLAAGIKSPAPLEELEIHLREEIERQKRLGVGAPRAFEISTNKIGQASELKIEFRKASAPIETQFVKLAGVACAVVAILFSLWILFLFSPEIGLMAELLGLAAVATTAFGWRYLKAGGFILPAFCIWVFSCVFVLPKLEESYAASGVALPQLVVSSLIFTDFLRRNILIVSMVVLSALVLLKWRSLWLSRYRRLILGTVVFVLNSAVLIVMTAMVTLAVFAGTNLLHHAK